MRWLILPVLQSVRLKILMGSFIYLVASHASIWDSISAISDSCGDGDGYRRKSPGVIVSMSEKWDDLAGEAVENF